MTSLVAWCGVDSRGPTSLYIATDSRVTAGHRIVSDGYRKTYVANHAAHIFGYCGDVFGPASTLPTVSEHLDRGAVPTSVAQAQEQFRLAVEATWEGHSPAAVDTILVHGFRTGESRSEIEFGCQLVTLRAGSKALEFESVPMPPRSSRLAITGSGQAQVRRHLNLWVPVVRANRRDSTSRAVFSAFCDSLSEQADPHSGGPPQLVGLWAKGLPHNFGVIWKGGAYVSGARESQPGTASQYFDRHFQRVDYMGRLLEGAQRHAPVPT